MQLASRMQVKKKLKTENGERRRRRRERESRRGRGSEVRMRMKKIGRLHEWLHEPRCFRISAFCLACSVLSTEKTTMQLAFAIAICGCYFAYATKKRTFHLLRLKIKIMNLSYPSHSLSSPPSKIQEWGADKGGRVYYNS